MPSVPVGIVIEAGAQSVDEHGHTGTMRQAQARFFQVEIVNDHPDAANRLVADLKPIA